MEAERFVCHSTKHRNFPEQATSIYVAIMLVVFPLFTGPEGYILLTEKKFIFFLVCTILWVTSLLIWKYREGICNRTVRGILAPDILIVLAIIGVIISTLSSDDRNIISTTGRCDGMLTYCLYGCILLGVFHYGTLNRSVFYWFAASYTIICSLSVLQLFGYNPLGLYPNNLCYQDPVIQEISPFLGTLGNIDVFSAMHSLVLPLLLSELIYGEKKKKWCMLLPLVLGVICLLWAGVASGILSLFLTSLIVTPILLVCHFPLNLKKHTKYLFWILFSVGGLLICFLCIYRGNWTSQTLLEFQQLLHGNVAETFGSNRIRIWKRTLEIIGKNTIWGVGADNLCVEMDIIFKRYSFVMEEWIINSVDNAHNEYLNYLATFGLVGSIPLLILLSLTWYKLLTRYAQSKVIQYFAPSFLCYSIQAFFNIGLCLITPLILIEWGLILQNIYIEKRQDICSDSLEKWIEYNEVRKRG